MATSSKKGTKSRNTMYYKKPQDRELMRDSDLGTEDSSDPMNSDSYGAEDEIAGEPGGPKQGFSVPTSRGQKDDLGGGLTVRLRKRGAPKGKG